MFSRGQTAGGENFYRKFVFYVQKTTFQGSSSIVMDVQWPLCKLKSLIQRPQFIKQRPQFINRLFVLKFDVIYPSSLIYRGIDFLQQFCGGVTTNHAFFQ